MRSATLHCTGARRTKFTKGCQLDVHVLSGPEMEDSVVTSAGMMRCLRHLTPPDPKGGEKTRRRKKKMMWEESEDRPHRLLKSHFESPLGDLTEQFARPSGYYLDRLTRWHGAGCDGEPVGCGSHRNMGTRTEPRSNGSQLILLAERMDVSREEATAASLLKLLRLPAARKGGAQAHQLRCPAEEERSLGRSIACFFSKAKFTVRRFRPPSRVVFTGASVTQQSRWSRDVAHRSSPRGGSHTSFKSPTLWFF